MANWLPIDQAPKDGTKILVYGTNLEHGTYDSSDKEEIGIAQWVTFFFVVKDKRWMNDEGYYSVEWFPTHFMPLPAPPADSPIAKED